MNKNRLTVLQIAKLFELTHAIRALGDKLADYHNSSRQNQNYWLGQTAKLATEVKEFAEHAIKVEGLGEEYDGPSKRR